MAVPDGLPSDVVQFVNDRIDSIEQRELLVMLIESSRLTVVLAAFGRTATRPGAVRMQK